MRICLTQEREKEVFVDSWKEYERQFSRQERGRQTGTRLAAMVEYADKGWLPQVYVRMKGYTVADKAQLAEI